MIEVGRRKMLNTLNSRYLYGKVVRRFPPESDDFTIVASSNLTLSPHLHSIHQVSSTDPVIKHSHYYMLSYYLLRWSLYPV